jgi:hypothetical protein
MQTKVRQFLNNRKARKWMWWGLAVFVALQIYFVREMLAALLLFTVAFLTLAVIALGIYLLDEVSLVSLDWAATHLKASWHIARHASARVEDVTRKQLDRIRSAPAR